MTVSPNTAARTGRIVLRREPTRAELTAFSVQADLASLIKHLLADPAVAKLDSVTRIARAYDAVHGRYDPEPPRDAGHWQRTVDLADASLDSLVNDFIEMRDSGYRHDACASPVSADGALLAMRSGTGEPAIFAVGEDRRLYLFARTADGGWSQSDLSSAIAVPRNGHVQSLDLRQDADGTIALALAVSPRRGAPASTVYLGTGLANDQTPAQWQATIKGLAAASGGPAGAQVSDLALAPNAAGKLVLLVGALVGGTMNNYYVDPAAAGSPWTEVRLPEEAQTLRAYALGGLGRLGIWALYEDGPDVALTFTTFPDRYGKTINLAYEELPAHAASMRVVASASGSKPDVYVAGDGIAVYRSGTHEAPEKVAGAAGATLVWADRTGSTERVAYTDAGNAVWLTTKPADGAWSVPIKIAEGVRRAVLCASADGGSVDLVVLTPGGALELRSLDGAATASEIPQRAVWEEAPLSAADLGRAIASCAPLIYFDEKEKFLPSDVEFYLRTVGFWDEIHGRWQLKNGTLWDAAARDLRAEALAILPRSAPDNSKRDCDYNLRIDEADFDHLKGGRLNGAPIYVHAKFKPADNCTDLVFWSFYPYNGPGTLRLTAAGSTRYSSLDPLGVHEGDWEHFTIRVDNDSLQPQKVYTSAHDGGDWTDFASLEQDGATGRKVLYVSRNGHATYAQAGDNAFHENEGKLAGVTVWAFALVNICSKGPAWKTWEKGTAKIVSATFLGPEAPVEPRWIAFPWRWGRYQAVSQHDMAGVIRTVLGPIGNMPFAAAVEEAVGKAVVDSGVLGTEGYSSGPEPIKFKSNWFAAE